MRLEDTRLILASGSPRRQMLLREMGFDFDIIVPNVDENVEGPARDIVAILSRLKGEAVADSLDKGLVIASDTLVSLNGRAMGKPSDKKAAFEMLRSLSDREHEVFTGVTIIDAASGDNETRVVRTGVRFGLLSDEVIREYIATGEPMDKAGAYAIQGGAGKFVTELNGSMNNVIGFPTEVIKEMLCHFISDKA